VEQINKLIDKWSEEEQRLKNANRKCPDKLVAATARMGTLQECIRELIALRKEIFGE